MDCVLPLVVLWDDIPPRRGGHDLKCAVSFIDIRKSMAFLLVLYAPLREGGCRRQATGGSNADVLLAIANVWIVLCTRADSEKM